jgi:transposase
MQAGSRVKYPLSPEPAMVKRYHVRLSNDERTHVEQIISRGKTSARVITRARILLKAADGANDEQIVEALGTSRATVERVRRRFATGGLDAAIKDKPQKGRPRALSSKQAAHLIAIACSDAPHGHDHWPLRLLGQKAVELGYVESISPETVRHVLEKK